MDNWKWFLLWMFALVIVFFWFVWYVNEKNVELPTIDSYCSKVFKMYDYDLENEKYEHQECRLYINQKKICEEEKEIFGEWEWLDRCLADLQLNKHNVLNLMK